MFNRYAGAVAALALMFAAGGARADLVGGTTSVLLDSTFLSTVVGAGLTVTPRGTATLGGSPPVARFPITGNTPSTQIFHDGSGLRFSGGGSFLDLDAFVIDLATNRLTGTVNANGTSLGAGIPLFDITSSLDLTLTSTAATAIADTFGLGGGAATSLTGLRVGRATVTAAVPEPATLALLVAALGLAALAARRRRVERFRGQAAAVV
jgi:hypothetical protein